MNLRSLIALIPLSLAVTTYGSKQRRAPPLGPNPLPTTTSNTDTTDPTAVTPTTNPSGSSISSNPPLPTSLPASTSGQNTATGFPSITGPSMSSQSSNSDTSQSITSSDQTPQTSTVTVTSSTSGDTTSTSFSSSATPSNTGTAGGGDSDNNSVGTGTIIGLSVAGGIAVFGAIAFIVWKFTRKRFSEFDADGEEIKWPELGPESHALPTRPTGRVGVDDDGYDDARIEGAGRHLGNYAASSSIGDASTGDLHAYNDPYAVPPLPHLDPNQPYHDDPSQYGGHYDPYHGPIPASFHDPATADRTSSHSPAPGSYGRQSPGPSIAYARTGY